MESLGRIALMEARISFRSLALKASQCAPVSRSANSARLSSTSTLTAVFALKDCGIPVTYLLCTVAVPIYSRSLVTVVWLRLTMSKTV